MADLISHQCGFTWGTADLREGPPRCQMAPSEGINFSDGLLSWPNGMANGPEDFCVTCASTQRLHIRSSGRRTPIGARCVRFVTRSALSKSLFEQLFLGLGRICSFELLLQQSNLLLTRSRYHQPADPSRHDQANEMGCRTSTPTLEAISQVTSGNLDPPIYANTITNDRAVL